MGNARIWVSDAYRDHCRQATSGEEPATSDPTASASGEDEATEASIRDRIRALEAELSSLRRLVGPTAAPSVRFAALHLRAGDRDLLVPVTHVAEVLQMVHVTSMVDSPPFVLGSFRFGPLTVPLVDLGARLTMQAPTQRPTDVIVLLDAPRWLGLAVTEAQDVVWIDPERLEPPPEGFPIAPFITATYAAEPSGSWPLLSIELLGRELGPQDG